MNAIADYTHIQRAAIDGAIWIPLELCQPSPTNPRRHFDEKKLSELTESIRKHGLMQPILVRPIDDAKIGGPLYEIVAGERRWRACKAASAGNIMAISRTMSDFEVLELQLVENLQRDDLHPLEEAEGFRQLMTDDGLSKAQIAEQFGKSLSYVHGRLTLLEACPAVRQACLAGEVGSEVALLVARLRTAALQTKALAAIKARNGDIEDGGRKSFRHIRDLLREQFTLDLQEALFDPADPALLPGAGDCTSCPKRTANAPEYADMLQDSDDSFWRNRKGNPNLCTDPDCFAAKKKAHLAAEAARLVAKGKTVVEGNKARAAISAQGEVKGDYIPLAKVRELLKDKGVKVEPVVIQNPRDGKTVQAVRRSDLQAAGVKVQPPPKSHVQNYKDQQREWDTRRKQLAAACEVENRRRMALVQAVRAAMQARPRDGFDLRLVAQAAVAGVQWNQRHTLAQLWDFDDDEALREAIGSLTAADCTQLMLDCALVQDLYASSPRDLETPPEVLMAAAAHYGIDAEAVRAAAVPEPTAEPAPAAQTPANGAKKAKKGKAAERAAAEAQADCVASPA